MVEDSHSIQNRPSARHAIDDHSDRNDAKGEARCDDRGPPSPSCSLSWRCSAPPPPPSPPSVSVSPPSGPLAAGRPPRPCGVSCGGGGGGVGCWRGGGSCV